MYISRLLLPNIFSFLVKDDHSQETCNRSSLNRCHDRDSFRKPFYNDVFHTSSFFYTLVDSKSFDLTITRFLYLVFAFLEDCSD